MAEKVSVEQAARTISDAPSEERKSEEVPLRPQVEKPRGRAKGKTRGAPRGGGRGGGRGGMRGRGARGAAAAARNKLEEASKAAVSPQREEVEELMPQPEPVEP